MTVKHPRSRPSLIHLSLLIAFIWLSWGLRLYDLEGKSIWSDEGLSIYRARKSITFNLTNQIIVEGVVTKDTQPSLYFLLLHALRAVAGESEFALRYLSVLFATLLIPLLYITGKRLLSGHVGLVASFLGAASPTYLWYAQEVRMYTMLVFASSLSVYALLCTLSESVGWRRSKVLWLVTYLLTTGAMIYTHYSGFFLLFFQGMVIAVFIVKSGRWRMIGLVGVAFLVALPLAPFILRRLGTGVERDYTFVRLPIILHDLLNGFAVGISVDSARTVWLNLLGLLIFIVGLLSLKDNNTWMQRGKAFFLLGYLLIPVLVLYAASYIKPMYMGVRHLLIISPAYYLGAAAGFTALTRRRMWPVALIAGLLLLGGNAYATYNYFRDQDYAKDDLRSMVRYIRQRFRSGDVLVLNDAVIGEVFAYYAPDLQWTALPHFGHRADGETIQECQALANTYQRIWFVYGPPSTYYDPQGLVQSWLEQNLFKIDFRRFPGYGIEVGTSCYATSSPILEPLPLFPTMPKPEQPDPAVPLTLLRYELPVGPNPSGEPLAVTFYWWLSRPAEVNYKVSVRLRGLEGSYWAQEDREPFYFFPTTQWPPERVIRHTHEILLPPGTPPGNYRLELKVYRPDRGEVLNISDLNGSPLGESITLGEVQVGPAIRPVMFWELPPHCRANVTFRDEITLLAYTWWERIYHPGDVLHLDFYWRAEKPTMGDYRLRVQLSGADGQVLQEVNFAPASDGYPTSAWRVGDILRGQCNLALPRTLTAGGYRLHLQLYEPGSGRLLPVRSSWLSLFGGRFQRTTFRLPDVPVKVPVASASKVQSTILPPVRPAIQHPQEAKLGEAVAFLGYDLATDIIAAGNTLLLTLYWECQAPMPISYSVFTHVIDEQGRIWGQKDSVPVGGSRPTSSWAVGEIITDTYQIPIKGETPPGEYPLEIGMYDLSTLDRLPAFDAAGNRLPFDRILLGSVHIVR